jgi:imidazolonepropionase-like amidohydrolase
VAGCAATGGVHAPAAVAPETPGEAYASTYAVNQVRAVVIRGARLLIGNGEEAAGADIRFANGRIQAVGPGLAADPARETVIDGAGKWVTPGLIDVHSHLGDYPAPEYDPTVDVNEATAPVTAEVAAEHAVWPQDPQFPLALAGGVTSLQILPGSANLIGGRGVTLKNVPARTVQEMKFPAAPYGLKMACGENPKRIYGARNTAPSTRMGNVAGYRAAWIKAQQYQREWDDYQRDLAGSGMAQAKPPKRDLQLETLATALRGEILVHIHCYRADEMAVMIDMAREFGYRITAFHHAVEAYKVADLLAGSGICAALWADWWGFKLESFDGIDENIALVDRAGGCAIVHSDSPLGIQRLNQEAAKAMAAGNRLGLAITPARAIAWITGNPARALGIDAQTGTLAAGRMADLVLWSGDPFSVYSRPEKVFIDGRLVYDRADPALQPSTDFELGTRELRR